MNMRRVVVVVLSLLVLSAVVGGLWVLLAPTPEIIVEKPGSGRYASEADPAKLFSALAVFAFLSFGLGVVIALVSWFGLRFTRGPAGLAFVAVMSIATSALAVQIGTQLGRLVHGEIDLNVPGTYRGTVNLWIENDVGPSWILLICAPAAAILIYLVCVISSNHADLGVGDDVEQTPPPVLVGAGVASPVDGFVPIDSGASGTSDGPVTSGDEGPRTRP
ncbi:DUF2567 domain-containing protein [Gordonia phthalatica]|uniref:DUF2567 domain-containing protein n=1 Tax=Gordonia phthalatica TaxID=1136941 RepID=A0A0N9N410_9ACTN|nr:DUF2567 domain-containing protein [Gordonia phthalatica]ALG85114.1 hypothetical protein ACH46_12290 [Gordonia phthalatica]